jgi:hypothetical protein
MLTISGFDEDGICDFEFVYVCVPQENPSNVPDENEYIKTVKSKIFNKIKSEMTRIESLLGGQTSTAPTTAEGTLKQYYDTIDLKCEQPITSNETKDVLEEITENIEEPCTLISKSEGTAPKKLVWKVAKATSIQRKAFNCVVQYLVANKITQLDNEMIRVYKISSGQSLSDSITVFVEVKKIENNNLTQVVYQALGGECYDVYNNYTSAKNAATLTQQQYEHVTALGTW